MKLKIEVANGGDPAGEKQAARRAAKAAKPADLDLIDKIIAQFLKRQASGYQPNTLGEVSRIMNWEILPAWRGRCLSSITKPEIHDSLDKIVDRGAPIAANRALSWLKRLGAWAVGRGLIDANPCAGITNPTEETARSRTLSNDELAALWLAADALEAPYREFVLLLILTAQRRNEVSALVWSEIDLDRRIWTLPASRAKNKCEHEIPLSEAACAILRGIPRVAGCDFVFSVTGKSPIRCSYLIKCRLDRLMPPDTVPWVMHDIRRTAATNMAGIGIALPVVEKLLNHTGGSFAGIAGVYQRFDFADQKRTAMETWSRYVLTLVSGEADNVVVRIRHGK